MKNYDIIIVGAGFVGLSCALSLSKKGFKIALLDKQKITADIDKNSDGRGSAISWFSYNFFKEIGVWQGLEKHAQPIKDILVYDSKSPILLHFDPQEINQDKFGYIVHNPHLKKSLSQNVLRDTNIDIYDNFNGLDISKDSDSIGVKSLNIKANLLLGVDGKLSKVRDLCNIKFTQKDYKQTAIVFSVKHSLDHKNYAHEKFTPSGPFAVLPMTENRSNIVWTETNDKAKALLSLPQEVLIDKLKENLDGLLGDIELSSKVFSYPLNLTYADSYISEKIALVGDAAHSIHPIAGQGFNLGVRDIYSLVETLTSCNKEDIGNKKTLELYQSKVKKHNKLMIESTDKLNILFSNDSLSVKHIRNFGLDMVSKIPAARKFFMSFASGNN